MSDLFTKIVEVSVPVRVNRSFHYVLTPEQRANLVPGSVVEVKFRNRPTHAFVLGFPEKSDYPVEKLKAVESVLFPAPIFDEKMLKFLTWVSEYYCHPLGEVISAAVPKQAWTLSERKRKSKKERTDPSLGLEARKPPVTDLTAEQTKAVDTILNSQENKAFLLHGVTGSGKTEVYITVLEKVLAQGKGAIILVPEIALTPQLVGRFSQRFPGQIAVLHSDLTPRERGEQWLQLHSGKARIVIGARSAVFAPIHNLGLIVVDEEHETSFKQEDSLRYHARDLAVVRGSLENAKVILGSATPSLESMANAKAGKFILVPLTKRVQDRPLPKTFFVDLKDQEQQFSKEAPWITKFLIGRIEKTMREGQQAMLYLNRLGYAHFLFCQDCGHTWRCRNCDVALTYYKHPPSLRCHYCALIIPSPDKCQECEGTHMEAMGVGTEQVERVLTQLFPKARIGRMDRSVIKGRAELEDILQRIAAKEVDIVIGTQMIAKGHDFPGIALVGILVADASLNLPDFRAHERTFQVITQVSGRAGRADVPGEVVIQSLNPQHPILLAAAENRSDDYYRWELDARRTFGFPPFQRMAMLRFQHKNEAKVVEFARAMAEQIKYRIAQSGLKCEVVGPAEAPLSKLKNVFRWQALLKSDSVKELHGLLHFALDFADSSKSGVGFAVDVDPVSSL